MTAERDKNGGQIIARRTLSTTDGKTIKIEVYLPVETSINGTSVWTCSYRIEGLVPDLIRKAAGEDSIQAVWGALTNIGSFLYTSDEYKNGNLHLFSPDGPRNLGFPALSLLDEFLHNQSEFEIVRI